MSRKSPSQSTSNVVIGAGTPILNSEGGGAPDWIMVLPASTGGAMATMDGRGPYRLGDAATLAATSLQMAGGRLPIDENHATDLAAPKGQPSPARGWITEIQPRADGVWGRVEWSEAGKTLMAERAYRFLSPVFHASRDNAVTRLLRASLVNTPNLRGMVALNSEELNMDLLAQLRKLLGLADDADEAAVIAKITELNQKPDEPAAVETALQSALAPIAKVVGAKVGADAATVLAAVTTLAAGKSVATDDVVVSLQSELKDVTTKFNTLTETISRKDATAFVDGAIGRLVVGIKPLRDKYISMHMADPAGTEELINAMPSLGASGATLVPPRAAKDGEIVLNSEQASVAKILGIKPEDYVKTLAAEAAAR